MFKVGDRVTVGKIDPEWVTECVKDIKENKFGVVVECTKSERMFEIRFGKSDRTWPFSVREIHDYEISLYNPYKILVGQTYKTKAGQSVEIVRTDLKGGHPILAVIAECRAVQYTKDGCVFGSSLSMGDDLVITPEFEIDELVEVRFPISTAYICDKYKDKWYKRYFAGYDADNNPTCYMSGATSETETATNAWKQIRKVSNV